MVVMGVIRNLEQGLAHGSLSKPEEAKADVGLPDFNSHCAL